MNSMAWGADTEQLSKEAEPIDTPRRELKTGIAIAVVFFGGLVGWAALTPLDAGALADGVVAVSGNRQAVQHNDGGVVTALSVAEGKLVRKGDVLATISAPDLVATERGLTGEIAALLAQRARLIAERDYSGTVREPAEFAMFTGADRIYADEALRGQRLLFEARRKSQATEASVLNQRVRQHSEQIGGLRHQMRSNQEQRRLLTEEIEALRGLVAEGFVSTNRIRAMERGAAQLTGEYGALEADVARTLEAVGETQLQSVSLDRRMIEDVALQLRDVQVRLDELQPRLVAAREKLAQSIVRAPATGKVVGLKMFTVGGVVGAGETLMEIVPQDKALVIEAKAAPTDADDLKIGMKTQVRFTALQERNLPVLHGRISQVSADSFEDERTGARFFRIEVVVPPEELEKVRNIRGNQGIRAGLPAEVLVPLRKRSALAYLLEPLTQTLWRAGREQ